MYVCFQADIDSEERASRTSSRVSPRDTFKRRNKLFISKKSFLKRSLSYDTSQSSHQAKTPAGSTYDRESPASAAQQLLALKQNVYATLTQSPVLLRHHSHLCDVKSLACKACRRKQSQHAPQAHLQQAPDIVRSTLNVRPLSDDLNEAPPSGQHQQFHVDLHQQLISERCNSWKSAFFAPQTRSRVTSADMDKTILKVHQPNGGFKCVKCGDATYVKVGTSSLSLSR